MSGWLTIELPAPPSVNDAWANVPGRGRVRTARYRDWASNAGWKLRLQLGDKRVVGRCIIIIGVERHNKTADIDNRIKPLLDLLVEHHAIDDDKHVDAVAIAWNPPGSSLARITIIPTTDGLGIAYHLAGHLGAFGGWFINAPGADENGIELEQSA